jgi:hypothetical protein
VRGHLLELFLLLNRLMDRNSSDRDGRGVDDCLSNGDDVSGGAYNECLHHAQTRRDVMLRTFAAFPSVELPVSANWLLNQLLRRVDSADGEFPAKLSGFACSLQYILAVEYLVRNTFEHHMQRVVPIGDAGLSSLHYERDDTIVWHRGVSREPYLGR